MQPVIFIQQSGRCIIQLTQKPNYHPLRCNVFYISDGLFQMKRSRLGERACQFLYVHYIKNVTSVSTDIDTYSKVFSD